MLRVICAFLVLLLFLFGTLAALLPTAHEHSMLGVQRRASFTSLSSQDSFTLIMQSFNRTDLLLKMLNHYQAMPLLHSIIVVWNNVGQDTPQELWESLGPHSVSVYFKKSSVNLMRNRLQNFPEIQTQDANTIMSACELLSLSSSCSKGVSLLLLGFSVLYVKFHRRDTPLKEAVS